MVLYIYIMLYYIMLCYDIYIYMHSIVPSNGVINQLWTGGTAL